MAEDEIEIYHEKQKLQRCGLHTVNNLFQRHEFSVRDFNEIARNLSPGSFVCPHKSVWGTGNYDINVIFSALTTREKFVKWWDRRKPVEDIDLQDENIFGLIINQQSDNLKVWKSKHWFAIVRKNGDYYNCNSNLSKPKKFEELKDLYAHLQKVIDKGGEVILALHSSEDNTDVKKDVEATSEEGS